MRAVEDGLKMAKRVYAGKDRQIAAAPRRAVGMARSADSFIPSAPMVYAVISDPAVVDNPDIPSYQPHVYGRCDPPALIPLHMGNIVLEVDCLLDSAFVSVSGQWRVHCVMRNKTCDCRLVVPMGEQVSKRFVPFLTIFLAIFSLSRVSSKLSPYCSCKDSLLRFSIKSEFTLLILNCGRRDTRNSTKTNSHYVLFLWDN